MLQDRKITLSLQPRILRGFMYNSLKNTKLTTNAWINWKENRNDFRFWCRR